MNLNYQWDRPLIDRARETLKAERLAVAIYAATPEQLREHARLMGAAEHLRQNAAAISVRNPTAFAGSNRVFAGRIVH